ncbi:transglycosylase SLT domain-containing protein [Lelliottia nimipressuralis]|uniref:transglycosylase SLT domain-containing protein n=1 Tax=Lelliottia nimipressuralis TaxID=69220 RepID=UPI00289D9B8D|nr:transglycosylase SLT domain-containing protein [Lelliottia nimipressuralis]
MKSKVLKKQSEVFVKSTSPKEIIVDDALRLKEIREIVKANNSSSLSDDLIICQIYMESRFNERSGEGVHSAKGLMQMQKNAVRQVYKYRLQKNTGKMPSDKRAAEAFSEADSFYESEKIYNENDNVKLGTEYMQYWIDKANGDLIQAYKKFRGKENGVYYIKIKSCADKLELQPDNMQLLRDMVK